MSLETIIYQNVSTLREIHRALLTLRCSALENPLSQIRHIKGFPPGDVVVDCGILCGGIDDERHAQDAARWRVWGVESKQT